MDKLIIVSRASKLALWQSNYIKTRLENHHKIPVEIIALNTKGDLILDKALNKIGGKGLFTKELEEMLLDEKAHLAVHSLKDVPVEFCGGLELIATCKRENPHDMFLSQKYENIEKLPQNAVVGTTSPRRALQIKMLRDDLIIKDLRGNINTRIEKLNNGEYDAIILASAGILRLQISGIKYMNELSKEIMIPAAGQGILGIECKIDEKISRFFEFLNDDDAMIESTIERDFISGINAGCGAPVGINAQINGNQIIVRAIVGNIDLSKIIKKVHIFEKNHYKLIGKELAKEFNENGAMEILESSGALKIFQND